MASFDAASPDSTLKEGSTILIMAFFDAASPDSTLKEGSKILIMACGFSKLCRRGFSRLYFEGSKNLIMACGFSRLYYNFKIGLGRGFHIFNRKDGRHQRRLAPRVRGDGHDGGWGVSRVRGGASELKICFFFAQ
jgi:hypothetical protein